MTASQSESRQTIHGESQQSDPSGCWTAACMIRWQQERVTPDGWMDGRREAIASGHPIEWMNRIGKRSLKVARSADQT